MNTEAFVLVVTAAFLAGLAIGAFLMWQVSELVYWGKQ